MSVFKKIQSLCSSDLDPGSDSDGHRSCLVISALLTYDFLKTKMLKLIVYQKNILDEVKLSSSL